MNASKKAESDDRFIKSGEAASILGVSQPTLYNWEDAGDLTPDDHTDGGHRLYRLSTIKNYLPRETTQQKSTKFNSNDKLPVSITEPNFNSEDFDDDQIKPIKSNFKVLDILISEFREDQGILILIIGMLLVLTIKLLYLVKAPVQLIHLSYEMHFEYSEFRNELSNELISSSSDDEDTQDDGYQEKVLHIDSNETETSVSHVTKIWNKTKQKAGEIYFSLTRASVNQNLDKEEQNRAKKLLSSISGPYQRLTRLLTENDPGSLKYDVARLLLFCEPSDYSISVKNWSIRRLSFVCTDILGTKSASKSQVGRLLKRLNWNCAIKPKILSPDPDYGPILQKIGHVFENLDKGDRVLYGDEFVYSTVKVAEYMKKKSAPDGLNTIPPVSQNKPYYRSKASILVNGLVDVTTNRLVVDELKEKNYDTYCVSLDRLLQKFISDHREDDTIYLIIDNAPYHSPKRLRNYIGKTYDSMVEPIFLPTYSPNQNPIERIWQYLLRNSLRCGEEEKELRRELDQAVDSYNSIDTDKNLSLTCEICSHKWEFNDKTSHEDSLWEHLCFNIDGLNPYTIYVLTHSVEHIDKNAEQIYPT